MSATYFKGMKIALYVINGSKISRKIWQVSFLTVYAAFKLWMLISHILVQIAEAAGSCATESIHSHNTPLVTLPLRPVYPSRHQTVVFTRMLIVINFARDEGFQLVVIGQRVLVSNTAAGTDGRAGIDVNYTISSTSRPPPHFSSV
jgi:hypothetical protein